MSDKPEETPPVSPNPAQLLARKRWEKESLAKRTADAQEAARKRWKDNPEGMVEFMREMARRPRPRSKGRLRIKERCPCGKYSATLAAKRGHKCSPPSPEV